MLQVGKQQASRGIFNEESRVKSSRSENLK